MSLAEPLSRNMAFTAVTPSRGRTRPVRVTSDDYGSPVPLPVQLDIRIRDANERRLGSLARQGIRVVLDGRDVLQFVLDHVCENWSEREFERQWVRHVSALLDQLDADLATQAPLMHDAP